MAEVFSISQTDAAVDQLDWAIKLLVDHDAPLPAITLAGAAEELLGKLAGSCTIADGASLNALALLKSRLSTNDSSEKNVADTANSAKTFIKHGKPQGASLEIELQTEAIQLILRAIINQVRLESNLSSQSPRFLEWLERTRPDLWAT